MAYSLLDHVSPLCFRNRHFLCLGLRRKTKVGQSGRRIVGAYYRRERNSTIAAVYSLLAAIISNETKMSFTRATFNHC